MDMESIEDDKVRAEIHRALRKVKAGNAFMLGAMQESDCEQILLDDEMLAKFFTYVSKSMTESWSPKNMKKKAEKQMSKLLHSKREMWLQEIRNFNRDPSLNKAKNEAEESTQPQDMKETRVTPKQSKKRKANDKSSKEKPKEKKPRRDSSGPKGRVAASTEELKSARAAAKKEFEDEKARILGEVPEEHKAKWGKVGLGKWGKEWLPCLIVGPYDVCPTSTMREQWLKMFENTKERRNSMTFLVYWYGHVDLSAAYSFLTAKNFQEYDVKLEKFPTKIQKKIDSGKGRLTKQEESLVRSFEEMREDFAKAPENRTRADFQELHEIDECAMIMGSERLDVELISDSSEEEDSDKDDLKPAAAKKISKPAKSVATEVVANDMDFAEDEVSADDSKDEEAQPSSSEDEEDDLDFDEEKAKSKPPPKKDKKKIGKHAIQRKRAKPKKEDTEDTEDSTPKKEVVVDTKPKKEATEDTKKRRERKKFIENEELFLPTLIQLKAAIKSKDTGVINHVIREMLDDVDSMGAPFMEAYEVSPLLKTAKGILKEQTVDISAYKQLWTKMANLYEEKKPHVPKDYKPQKREAKAPKIDDKSGHGVSRPEKESKIKEDPEPTSLERHESVSASTGSQLAEAVPLSPTKRGPSRDLSVASPKPEMEASSQAPKVTSQKPEKKSFSLNKLLSNPDPSGSRIKTEEGARSSRISFQKESIKIRPPWITRAPDELGLLSTQEVDRMFALEFLEGAASRFPAEEVNRESVARGLETAIYQLSQEQYKKEDTYWNKVHAIVAGICGKTKPGTLVAAIMAGEYVSAKDVATLPDDVLQRSFEG